MYSNGLPILSETGGSRSTLQLEPANRSSIKGI
jgi:hypothetical protein